MAALAIVGSLVGAVGSVISGVVANNQASAQASALDVKAGEERAASQREAISRAKEATYMQSKGQAIAAASGGGAADPTVDKLMADLGAQGVYQSGVALYEGETAARGDEFQAKLLKQQGKQALFSSFINASGSVLNGFSNFSSYSYQPPSSNAGPAPYFFGPQSASPASATTIPSPYDRFKGYY